MKKLLNILILALFIISINQTPSFAVTEVQLLVKSIFKKYRLNDFDYFNYDDLEGNANLLYKVTTVHPYFILDNLIKEDLTNTKILDEYVCVKVNLKNKFQCNKNEKVQIIDSKINFVQLPVDEKLLATREIKEQYLKLKNEVMNMKVSNAKKKLYLNAINMKINVHNEIVTGVLNLKTNENNVRYKIIDNNLFVQMSYANNEVKKEINPEKSVLTIDNFFYLNNKFYKNFSDEAFTGIIVCNSENEFKKFLLNSSSQLVESLKEFLECGNSKKMRQTFKNGLPNGEFLLFKNDVLIKKGFFKFGFKNGLFEHYLPNGKLRFKENFKFGKHHGKWISYYENGRVRRKMNYFNGKFDGETIAYHSNGNVFYQRYYINDKEDKVWKTFDENKNLIKSQEWNKGKLISENNFN